MFRAQGLRLGTSRWRSPRGRPSGLLAGENHGATATEQAPRPPCWRERHDSPPLDPRRRFHHYDHYLNPYTALPQPFRTRWRLYTSAHPCFVHPAIPTPTCLHLSLPRPSLSPGTLWPDFSLHQPYSSLGPLIPNMNPKQHHPPPSTFMPHQPPEPKH